MRLAVISVLSILLLCIHMSSGALVWIGLDGVDNANCTQEGEMCLTLAYALNILPENDAFIYIRFTGEYFAGPGYCNLTIPPTVDHISGDMDMTDNNVTIIDCQAATRVWYIAPYDPQDQPMITIDFITFYNATGSGFGGCIDSHHRDLTVSFSNFLNCYSDIEGGAISVGRNHSLAVVQCSFDDCYSEYEGGAVHAHQLQITGCNFTNCGTLGDGGAAWANVLSVQDSFFDNNSADNNGGALAVYRSLTLCDNNEFSGNLAANDGGAIYLEADPASKNHITDSYVVGNTADNYGGGLFLNVTYMELSDVYVGQNTGLYAGGIYFAVGSNAEDGYQIMDLVVSGNTAQSNGAGILATMGDDSTEILFNWFDNAKNSRVVNNTYSANSAISSLMLAQVACDTALCRADCQLITNTCDDCGGLCVQGVDGKQCLAAMQIDCDNHGQCVYDDDGLGYQVCKCDSGYTGDACDHEDKKGGGGDDKPNNNHKKIGIALGVVFGFLILAAVGGFFLRRHYKNKDKEYEPILPTRK